MPLDDESLPERERRLDEVVTAYLQALGSASPPDRETLCARHPDLAVELAEFFDFQDWLYRLSTPLRFVARAAEQATPLEEETTSADDTAGAVSPEAGREFGDYELLGRVGAGGMGVVYRARQKALNRLVALKVIRMRELASAGEARRFRGEAETAAALEHPHVVPVYEVGEHQGQLYYSMRLMEGGSLASQLGRFRDDPRGAARLVAQVARAVHHAHQRGILHRDLKPSNILLDGEGQPHVSDFGLAKRIESDGSLTQTGAIVGTPQYMAPEQTSGRKGTVTTATDVYGLGAVLYALLAGRPPFQGETVLETLEQVREREPESPRWLNAKVDRDLETICLKCLQKEQQRRYESAQALAEDLERWSRGESIQARRIRWCQRIWRWHRRNPFLAALTGLSAGLALALLIGLIVSSWLIAGQRDEIRSQHKLTLERERDLRLHLYASDIRLAWQALREGERERMSGLLDRHIPEDGQEDLRGFEWYYLQRRSRAVLHEAARVAAHEGGAYCVKYSPGGRTLASTGKDGVIRFWDARTLVPRGELLGGQGEINEVVFSPDGKSLASAGDDGTVWVWDLATARKQDILRPEGCRDELSALAISPDGKVLAAGGRDGGIWSWDFASGRLKAKLNPSAGWIYYLTFAPDSGILAVANPSDRVLLLDPATLQERGQLKHPYGQMNCVSFSHDGKTLVAGYEWQGRILLWDLAMRKQRYDLSRHEGSTIRSLSFSPDDALLVSGEDDGLVRLWDAHTVGLSASQRGHAGCVWSTAFARDGKWLATAGQDGSVKLWHVLDDDRRTIRVGSKVDTDKVFWLAFSPDGQTLFTRTWETGELKRWSTYSGQRVELLVGPAVPNLWAALASSSRLATVTGDYRDLRVQGLSGVVVQDYRHAKPITALAISPDGERVAFADVSGAGWMWEVSPAQPRELLRLPGGWTWIAFAPDGGTIAVLSNAQVLLLDARQGKCLAVLSGHEKQVPHPVFSPDGRLLATIAADRTIRVWEVPSGRERYCVWQPRTSVNAVAFSPDGKTMAGGTEEGEVILWAVAGGQELMKLDDHKGAIYDLAFSPDGKILAAGGHGPDGKSAEVTLWYADGARPNRDP